MKVTGFTFIKNAIKFDYPIKEAILSILPLCDEIVVAVGDCNDGTRELVAAIHPTKIKIIDTVWDASKTTGGNVLADETNKAFKAIDNNADWCIYIQGDEILHEDGIDNIRDAMLKHKNNKNIDGLLLKYLHFYGSYDYVGSSVNWYRNEIRIIKKDSNIYSYKDAQGFRKKNNEKLRVKPVNAFMYHYGWVKAPEMMQKKINGTAKFWGGDDVEDEKNSHKQYAATFDYSQINALEKFSGSHPLVMQQKIDRLNWKFDYDVSYSTYSIKEKIKRLLFRLTGKMFFEYQNYQIV